MQEKLSEQEHNSLSRDDLKKKKLKAEGLFVWNE